MFRPRPYQRDAILDTAPYQAWMWSRQTGKGFTAAAKINLDILEHMLSEQPVEWLVLSRSLPASRNLARKISGIGRAMCKARNLLVPEWAELGSLEETQFEITYPGGSIVHVLSSNPDAAVGFTGRVLIDEIDVHKQAAELFANTLPVASTGDNRVIVTSTPRGRRMMYKIATDAQRPGSEWSFRKLTIYEAVAQGCKQDPEQLHRALMDELKWKQEYLVEFIDDEICWIPWALIVQCTSDLAKAAISEAARALVENDVYAGWDVARWNHKSVLWVAERRGNKLVTREVERMQRIPFDQQIQRVARLRQYPKFRRLCVDATGIGEMPAEEIRKLLGSVEGIKFNNAVKEHLANGVRRAMEDTTVLIPDDEAIHASLHCLRRTVTGAGNYRFEGEENGSHADEFWAEALMIEAASTSASGWDGGGVEVVNSTGGAVFGDEDGEPAGGLKGLLQC